MIVYANFNYVIVSTCFSRSAIASGEFWTLLDTSGFSRIRSIINVKAAIMFLELDPDIMQTLSVVPIIIEQFIFLIS